MHIPISKLLPICVAAFLIALSPPLAANEGQQGDARDTGQRLQDAWVRGKLEAAFTFNRHLNPFDITTHVENGVVTLTGVVESDIDADLAGEIAEGLEGVEDVKNNLQVGPAESRSATDETDDRRSFGRWVDDATTTAAVRMALATNGNIKARDISIETRDDVVTLSGNVDTAQQSELAEQIARNTTNVRDVNNGLRVRD
jgi:hyperosmotically inducible periplasmic protein